MTKLLVLNLLVVSAQFYDTTAFYNKRAMPGQMEPELIENCERTSAMFAIRSCRKFCGGNYMDFLDECGSPGADEQTVQAMAARMRKMVTIPYCQEKYNSAIEKCLSMIA